MALHFEILVVATHQGVACQAAFTKLIAKISKCNAMPLVRVSLAFQHNSWAKEEGIERV